MDARFAFLLLCIAGAVLGEEPKLGRPCKNGEKGETPGLRWYFDDDRNKAYPFFYDGCGVADDSNRYNTEGEAAGRVIGERSICAGFVGFTGPCEGRTRKCPKGSSCLNDPNFPQCCPEAAEAKYNINLKAACTGGKKAVRVNGNILFGQKCAHKFCPKGSDCVQGAIEAYCCKK